MPTVKFYIKNPRDKEKKLRSNELSIYAVFTKTKKERFSITLDEKIQPKFWDFKNQRVRGAYIRHYELNAYLEQLKANLLNLYGNYRTKPFEEFRQAATTKKTNTEKKSIFVAYEKFLQAYKSEKDSKTCQKYATLLLRLQDFAKTYPTDLPILDFNFLDAFKAYLLQLPNPFYLKHRLTQSHDCYDLVEGTHGEPVGIFDDTVYMYLVELKTFLGWAEKRGYPVHQSYKTWQIIRRVHPPISLTSAELERLEHTTLSPALQIARDYLVFECRTGQRISDIKRFDLKDFHDDKWTFTPRKGNRLNAKQITVHFKGFCAPALDILLRYNWKMPIVSEQKINENIKKACRLSGIDSPTTVFRYAGEKRIKISGPKYEFISSHIGRKTMITLALQSGMPVEYIMALTGITEYKTIRHYKAKFEDSAIEKELEKMPLMRKAL